MYLGETTRRPLSWKQWRIIQWRDQSSTVSLCSSRAVSHLCTLGSGRGFTDQPQSYSYMLQWYIWLHTQVTEQEVMDWINSRCGDTRLVPCVTPPSELGSSIDQVRHLCVELSPNCLLVPTLLPPTLSPRQTRLLIAPVCLTDLAPLSKVWRKAITAEWGSGGGGCVRLLLVRE